MDSKKKKNLKETNEKILNVGTPVNTENDQWYLEEWKREKEKLQQLVDQQKADLQLKNRELAIEASIERVRAVAMRMTKQEDMLNICRVISEQLQQFQVEYIRNVQTVIINEEKGTYHNYQYFTPYEKESVEIVDYHKNPVMLELANRMLESADGFFTGTLAGDAFGEWRAYRKHDDQFPDPLLDETNSINYHFFSIGPGGLGITLYRPLNEKSLKIFKRFHNVFSLAYRRFRDIENAEEQARESEIQLALERVRSRSMSMHKSDELADLSLELVKQVHALGVDTWFCAFNIYDDHPEGSVEWGSNGHGTFPQYRTPREGVFLDYYEAGQRGETFLINEISEEECPAHYDYLCTLPGVGDQLLKIKADGIPFPVSQIDHVAYFNYGYILFITFEPFSESHDIFKRFAKVFEQTYTRFLDLQKAEHQAYESKVEASLERVRGMAAAMNHSDDLMQIAEEMFKEMEYLKINPLRYGISMIDDEKKEAEIWASTVNDGNYLDMLGKISLSWHPMLEKVLDAWDAQYEELTYKLKGKELSDYYQKIGQMDPNIPGLEKLQDPNTNIVQYVSFFPFKSGALYAFTEGKPSDDGKSILKRFTSVFEQAHIRYDDLQTAEKQAQLIREERDRLEITLEELKATQEQLVQQEKLASLGQLTAGIAHEIKNPLNFVNNFSDVSLEMIDEALEELLQIGENEHASEAATILADIKSNLSKIHEHGSRADGIVQSMLMHSRGGDGKMEPTPLNPIIKEYVNLAFHGMRAGKEPINVDIDLQLDESVGDVPLVAEDFSRVILNLVNNAFDAMRDKLTGGGGPESGYVPKLTVRTHQTDKAITIEIEDNGPGIPEEIKDKIMQPFFTTKKGTAGTGLGLSITHDIIKAHGGNMELESVPGKTVFMIKILNKS